jgi:hypothetical protein
MQNVERFPNEHHYAAQVTDGIDPVRHENCYAWDNENKKEHGADHVRLIFPGSRLSVDVA